MKKIILCGVILTSVCTYAATSKTISKENFQYGLKEGSSVSRGGEGVGGGDAFDIGNGRLKIYDQIEYSEPFYPSDEEAYKKIILPQLQRLAQNFPRTSNYLKYVFDSGAMWFLVDAKLKDVDASGASNVFLSFKKIQAGVTQKGVTQINKRVWKALSLESQAYLLMHEMLWTAETDSSLRSYIGDTKYLLEDPNYHILNRKVYERLESSSSNIRTLTAILLNKNVLKYDPKKMAQIIQAHLGWQVGPLADFYPRLAVGFSKTNIDGIQAIMVDGHGHATGDFSYGTNLKILTDADVRMANK